MKKRIRRVTQKFSIQEPSSAKSVSAKKKKVPLKALDAESRPFIDHLMINVGFLLDHGLERVVELLENQEWISLFLGNCLLNKDLARQFFSTLTISGEDSCLQANFLINGLSYSINHKELGMMGSLTTSRINGFHPTTKMHLSPKC